MSRQRVAQGDSSTPERLAGFAFLAFVVFQVPAFLAETSQTREGYTLLSPLQVTMGHLANVQPRAIPAAQAVLLPGTWTRDALAPYLSCLYKNGFKGHCEKEQARLSDGPYLTKMVQLKGVQKFVSSNDMKGQERFIIYGCAMIVVSALMAPFYTVKTAIIGFGMLFWGVVKADMQLLPPAMMISFLCVYSGFQLDQLIKQANSTAQRRPGTASSDGAAGRAEGPVAEGQGSPYSGSAKKAAKRTAAKRKA